LADTVLVLTKFVAAKLQESGQVRPDRIATLFHPDFDYRGPARLARAHELRLLFFGRILPYKGLHLFEDALERLGNRGVAVRAGVYGDGRLGREMERLARMQAEVRNNWIDDCDIPSIFSRYDVLVLSHTEASQSGVAAAALGAGLPVIVTPVGGLTEQIRDSVTGLVSERADSDALRRLSTPRGRKRPSWPHGDEYQCNKGRTFDDVIPRCRHCSHPAALRWVSHSVRKKSSQRCRFERPVGARKTSPIVHR
jgi:hypothetical protein